MKIAMVTPYWPPRLGGREFWVDWMSRELVRRGVDVVVFTSNNLDYHRSRCRSELVWQHGVKIHKVAVWWDVAKYSTPIVFPPFWKLRREHPDIVHVNEPNVFLTTPLAFFAKFVLRKKVVTHCFSDPFEWYKQGPLFRLAMAAYGWMYDWKLRISDHIVSISEAYVVNSRYLSKYRDKMTILPMCLAPVFRVMPDGEAREFKQGIVGANSRVVLYVGRLDYRKGVDFLIRAMKSVDAKCILVGNGEKAAEDALRRLTESLGLSEKVLFVGRQDQETLNKFYNASDVLVLPTSDQTSETFGAVLLEAWASGKPVISVDNPAPTALIRESKGGLLVRREDAEDLARAINRVLGDGALAQELGANGREYVQRTFSFREVAERLVKLYEELLARKQG